MDPNLTTAKSVFFFHYYCFVGGNVRRLPSFGVHGVGNPRQITPQVFEDLFMCMYTQAHTLNKENLVCNIKVFYIIAISA
jgi:hypothetical protein